MTILRRRRVEALHAVRVHDAAGEKQLATMPEMENRSPLRLIPVLGGFLLISLLLVLITITVVAIIR